MKGGMLPGHSAFFVPYIVSERKLPFLRFVRGIGYSLWRRFVEELRAINNELLAVNG